MDAGNGIQVHDRSLKDRSLRFGKGDTREYEKRRPPVDIPGSPDGFAMDRTNLNPVSYACSQAAKTENAADLTWT